LIRGRGAADTSTSARDNVDVVIETPKGQRNKFKYDADLAAFRLTRVLPVGMVFPFDFGFLPQTHADDGDPLDVLVLLDAPAYPGASLRRGSSASCAAHKARRGRRRSETTGSSP